MNIHQVEGGKIDWAHHVGLAKTALDETVEFSDAIERTLQIVDLEVIRNLILYFQNMQSFNFLLSKNIVQTELT